MEIIATSPNTIYIIDYGYSNGTPQIKLEPKPFMCTKHLKTQNQLTVVCSFMKANRFAEN